jgi:hypothetical protein
MKFDELKEIWNQESNKEMELQAELEKIKEYRSPFQNIRNNLFFEFVFTWIGVLFVCIVVSLVPFYRAFHTGYLLAMLVMALIPTIYYHLKFYKFYKRYFINGIGTFNALMDFSKKMTEFISDYRTYNYLIILILSNFFYAIIEKTNKIKIVIQGQRDKHLEYVILMLIIFFLIFITTEIYINYKYKRNLNKINDLIREMEKNELSDSDK